MGVVPGPPFIHQPRIRCVQQATRGRDDIRNFLVSRRARITPDQVGLPSGPRRRVPGLRRGEVAVLAGVSTEWYTRLEKGHIVGVSEEVLLAVARALRLGEDERAYLLELSRSSRQSGRRPSRPRDIEVPRPVQWALDSITMSSAFIRDGRTDVLASNSVARALFAPMFQSVTVEARTGRPNISRFVFLDGGAADFFVDWEGAGSATAALLRAEVARNPFDQGLQALIGELVSSSPQFRSHWAAHDVMMRHDGVKAIRHPEVGTLELAFRSAQLPLDGLLIGELILYTAEPGTPSEDRVRLLAIMAASHSVDPA